MKLKGGEILIQDLANKITQYMFKMKVCNDEFEVHRYGIEVMISTTIDVLLILGIGFIMGHLEDAIIYYLAFWIIRKFSGGYHCQTYFRCISLHVSLFIVYLITFQCYRHWMLYIQIFAILVFIIFSPVRNRELDNSEYRKYKILSLIILIGFITFSYISHYANILTYVILIVSILMIACIRNYES